jgi:hypothetical protein
MDYLDQNTIQAIVAILGCGWLLLLVGVVAGKGTPIKRRAVTIILTLASLVALVLLDQQTRRRMSGHYAPSDDEQRTTPAPYHVRSNDWEQV